MERVYFSIDNDITSEISRTYGLVNLKFKPLPKDMDMEKYILKLNMLGYRVEELKKYKGKDNIKLLVSQDDVIVLVYGKISIGEVSTAREIFYATRFKSVSLEGIDTSGIRIMNGMFADSDIGKIDFTGFDLSKVNSVKRMFDSAWTDVLDLSHVDLSNIMRFDSMFEFCRAGVINLGDAKIDDEALTYSMFYDCSSKLITTNKRLLELYEKQRRQ